MKLRVSGSRSECEAFADMIRQSAPGASISKFYKDDRGTGGRIYIDLGEVAL